MCIDLLDGDLHTTDEYVSKLHDMGKQKRVSDTETHWKRDPPKFREQGNVILLRFFLS